MCDTRGMGKPAGLLFPGQKTGAFRFLLVPVAYFFIDRIDFFVIVDLGLSLPWLRFSIRKGGKECLSPK